jgi:hypothetical protein
MSLAKNCKITSAKIRKCSGKRQDRLMLRNSEGKLIQEEKVAEHCRLYFERLLNEGFIENGVNGKAAGESGIIAEFFKSWYTTLSG